MSGGQSVDVRGVLGRRHDWASRHERPRHRGRIDNNPRAVDGRRVVDRDVARGEGGDTAGSDGRRAVVVRRLLFLGLEGRVPLDRTDRRERASERGEGATFQVGFVPGRVAGTDGEGLLALAAGARLVTFAGASFAVFLALKMLK